jgi:uncharacterized protein YjbI with pentapeptide repeats
LSGANLTKADLAYADLSLVNLSRTDLTQANLTAVLIAGACGSEVKLPPELLMECPDQRP